MAAGRRKKTTSRTRRTAPPPEVETEETEETEEEEGDGDEDEEPETTDSDDEEEEENSDPVRPTLSAKEKGKLFKAYQEATNTLGDIEEAMLAAKAEQSEAVKEIFDQIGPGPFLWQGKQIKVVSRKGKYFMRVESAAAEEIEA